MKNKFSIYSALFGLILIFSSCEKDGELVYFSPEDVIPPQLITVPDLTLASANATDTLVFVGEMIDAGISLSATYYLEACVSGNGFEDEVRLTNDVQDTIIKVTVEAVNKELTDILDAGQTGSLDFRIRARLTVDSGRLAPGTPTDPFDYNSNTVTKTVTTY